MMGKLMLPEAPASSAHVVIDTAFHLMPPLLGTLLAAAVIAIIISTADSFLLACSTTAATDLGGGLTTPKKQRTLVVALGLIALALAFTSDAFFDVALYAYTLYGVTITPAMICALLFPGVARRAVVWGMGSGLIFSLAWKAALEARWLPDGWSDVEAVLPALVVNVAVLLIVNATSPSGPIEKGA
jgi:SSS family solute:Na+ symporter